MEPQDGEKSSEQSDREGRVRVKSPYVNRIFFVALVSLFLCWCYFLEYPSVFIASGANWSFYGSLVTTYFPNANPYYLHLGNYETYGSSQAALASLSNRWNVILPIPFGGAPNIPLLVTPVIGLTYFFLGGRKHLKAAGMISVIIALSILF